jgi:hypothetical protein
MNAIKRYVPLTAALLLGACVTVPSGPSVVALPGNNKSFDQFQADAFACQQFAQQSVGGTAEQANNYAASNAVAGTALGAAAGAIIGSASGNAGAGAAIGAGTGLLFGSAAGSMTGPICSACMPRAIRSRSVGRRRCTITHRRLRITGRPQVERPPIAVITGPIRRARFFGDRRPSVSPQSHPTS